jgi:hypothetical protein
MWLDKENMFSEEQDISQTAAAYNSTNVIDLGGPKKGEGEPIEVLIQIIAALVGTSSTLQVKILTDDNVGFASAKTLYDSGAIAEATLVAGYKFPIRTLPFGSERFLKITYTIGTATTTAGTVTAGLVRHIPTNP